MGHSHPNNVGMWVKRVLLAVAGTPATGIARTVTAVSRRWPETHIDE